MAHVAENYGARRISDAFGNGFARLSRAISRRRIYKRTYAELNALSTRELNDLGISRSMISRLAYEAALAN
jgi:uncharacterized protein YjiS (DUF1127 family)